jgi:fermentation-respiration switch protein FrsA (DUF1100 family)
MLMRTFRLLMRVGAVLFVLALGLGGLAMLFEEKLIYLPERHPSGMWDLPELAAREEQDLPTIEDCRFVTEDGLNLHGWYCTPRDTANEPGASFAAERMILLFFHGNAGNLTYRFDMIRMLVKLPVDVFIIDYRGYGKSDGRPSEEGLYLDAGAAWAYLTRQRNTPPRRIVLLGKSLGGAVAIDLAARVHPAGLIVQSSFTSIPDMARTIVPFFPRFLVRTKMNSIQKIASVDCPKLFIHSPTDEVVPYRFGRRLFEAAREPKQFYEVPGAAHNDTYLVGGEAYLDTLRHFIRSCAPSRKRISLRGRR